MVRAGATLSERFLSLIGFAILLCILLSIRSEIRTINVSVAFREIVIDKSEQDVVICQEKSKPLSPHPYHLTTKFHTVAVGGGLGNQLFELISIIGIASTLGRTPLIPATDTGLIKELSNRILLKFPLILEQFSIKISQPDYYDAVLFNDRYCCQYSNVSELLMHKQKPLLVLEGYYFQSFKYFHHLRPDIRKWLSPRKDAMRQAQKHLPIENRNDFILCTHIRRGDFIDDGVHRPSDPNFTRSATEYLIRKHSLKSGPVSVVILGNDPLWAQSVFFDMITTVHGFSIPRSTTRGSRPQASVIVTPTLEPEVDLAFSGRFCDAVLITAPSSTFAWWLAYLAKPEAFIYYRDINETLDKVIDEMKPEDFYPSNWIKLQSIYM